MFRWFSRLGEVNYITLILSGCSLLILCFLKFFLEQFLLEKCSLKRVVIPIDIILIILLGFFAWIFNLHTDYGVNVIPVMNGSFGHLPIVPRFSLLPVLFTDALLLAFICYATTYSLQEMYAQRNGYSISPSQELWAMGMTNVIASFFQCFPCCGSLARSAVQDKMGGKVGGSNYMEPIFYLTTLSLSLSRHN